MPFNITHSHCLDFSMNGEILTRFHQWNWTGTKVYDKKAAEIKVSCLMYTTDHFGDNLHVQNTLHSQPIALSILTKLHVTTAKNNTKSKQQQNC